MFDRLSFNVVLITGSRLIALGEKNNAVMLCIQRECESAGMRLWLPSDTTAMLTLVSDTELVCHGECHSIVGTHKKEQMVDCTGIFKVA